LNYETKKLVLTFLCGGFGGHGVYMTLGFENRDKSRGWSCPSHAAERVATSFATNVNKTR
jgi:hypothetical protein